MKQALAVKISDYSVLICSHRFVLRHLRSVATLSMSENGVATKE